MKLIKHGELTSEQLHAIEYLALPKRGNMSYEEIAAAIGVSSKSLQRWRKEPIFQEAVRRRSLELMGERLPDVLASMVDRAVNGSGKHAELVLKSLGILKDQHVVEARPYDPEDDPRSNANIEREIERLSAELKAMGIDIDNNEEEQQ
ncbi:phBC6A51 family helix-turn-helix protein [Paenibacillus tarimensis]